MQRRLHLHSREQEDCSQDEHGIRRTKMANKKAVSDDIFPMGDETLPEYRKYYSGTAYEKVIVPYSSKTGVTVAHVTYAPGTRNDWHSHHGGQIVLALSGKGWHQEEGKEAIPVLPGDVIEIAPNVKHWHGAAEDSSYSYLAIKEISTAGAPEWFGKVSDEAYQMLSAVH